MADAFGLTACEIEAPVLTYEQLEQGSEPFSNCQKSGSIFPSGTLNITDANSVSFDTDSILFFPSGIEVCQKKTH